MPSYQGKAIKAGSTDIESIRAIQDALNTNGCGPVKVDGVFSAETQEALQLFQARSVDFEGSPLTVDGIVGPMTWAALFKQKVVRSARPAASSLAGAVLQVAAAAVGVMEQPPGSNRGPEVDQYLRNVGLNPASGSFAWCAAFIYSCFKDAAAVLGVPNPCVKTAGALAIWNLAGPKGIRRLTPEEAKTDPTLVTPGMVFVISTGGGHGHVGFIEKVAGVVLTTIEGNTNDGGSREGIGVFRRNGRRIGDINQGFVDFTARV